MSTCRVIRIQKNIRSVVEKPLFFKAPLIVEESLFHSPLFPYLFTKNKGIRDVVKCEYQLLRVSNLTLLKQKIQ